MPYYICSLPNRGEPGKIHELISDDPAAIEAFARSEDRPGRGVYFCVSTLKPGARRRSLETVDKAAALYVDIDFKDIVETPAEVDARLRTLWLRPGEIRNSGHGRHVVFPLKEPLDATDPRLAAALKGMTECLCGDMTVAHLAALLRRPGTHNSKDGDWTEVVCISRSDVHHDLTNIESWLESVGSRPLFTRRPDSNGRDGAEEIKRANGHASKPPIDVDALLVAMKFQGLGDSAIHPTQLRCMASLLRSGAVLREAARTVLDATRAAVANDPKWDWRKEELKILRMGSDFIVKNPELLSLLPEEWRPKYESALAEGRRPDIGWNRSGPYARRAEETSSRKSTEDAAGIKQDAADEQKARPHTWNYFDSVKGEPPRWLVKQLLPEAGVGIMSGQWGSFKTTAALDLSLAVMTGQPFAGQYRVKRRGAVLYFATEGAGTLQSRLLAIAKHRGAPEKLPFAWRGDCPLLTDKGAAQAIVKCVDEAAVHFEHAYGMPVTLIWVDTYITAAGLSSSGDDNDVAATQKAFNTLRFVSAHSGAFVVTIDHLGKVVEAGTRGSSGKEGNADTVMATLATREITGTVFDSRMAVRKQRDGISGFEVPFTPETIELGLDEDGDPITAVVLSWGRQQHVSIKRPRKSKDRDLLARTLMEVVAKRGFALRPEPGGPAVQACYDEHLREEFYRRRPAEGTAKQQADKRRAAYDRALSSAVKAGLIGQRQMDGGEVIWAR
jgi:hypothetical protein